MNGDTIYESKHPIRDALQSAITFGRVTAVNIAKRMITVKTFQGKGVLDDMHIPNCQWISLDAHPDGDESISIPRKDTVGLVFFIGGEPFFFGGIRGLDGNGRAITGDEAEKRLLPGDKVFGTYAGNRIVVKTNRLIDIVSRETLRRTYSPKDKRIIDLCSNYQISTDGGSKFWENLGPPLNLTVEISEFADSVSRLNILFEQKGYVSGSRIFQRDVGPGIPGFKGVKVPLYSESIDKDGTYKQAVGPASLFSKTINPDGSVTIGNAGMTLNITPTGAFDYKNQTQNISLSETGDLNYKNPTASIDLSKAGDFGFKNPTVTLDMTKDGEFKLDSSKAVAEFGKGKFELSGPGGKLLDTMGKIVEQLIDLTTAMQTEVHLGNLGYPSAPPTNAAQYAKVNIALTQLNVIIGVLKK